MLGIVSVFSGTWHTGNERVTPNDVKWRRCIHIWAKRLNFKAKHGVWCLIDKVKSLGECNSCIESIIIRCCNLQNLIHPCTRHSLSHSHARIVLLNRSQLNFLCTRARTHRTTISVLEGGFKHKVVDLIQYCMENGMRARSLKVMQYVRDEKQTMWICITF